MGCVVVTKTNFVGFFPKKEGDMALMTTSGPLLRICNWVGHLSQGTKNNVKRGPEKNRNFEKSKNRKIEKIEKSKFCRSKFPI